jgi:hypothetical protein
VRIARDRTKYSEPLRGDLNAALTKELSGFGHNPRIVSNNGALQILDFQHVVRVSSSYRRRRILSVQDEERTEKE